MIYFLSCYIDEDMWSKGQLMSPGPHTELLLRTWAEVPAGLKQATIHGYRSPERTEARMRPSASPKEAAVAHLHQFCPQRMQIYPCQCFSFQEKADTYRKYFDRKRWSTRTRDHTLLDMSRQKVPMGWTSLTATDGHLWEAKATAPWRSFLQF